MEEILFINACVRTQSRTRKIADLVLSKLEGNITEVCLNEIGLKPLDRESLDFRTKMVKSGNTEDAMFDYAKQFSKADRIVIAAPYWDLSFPACLKTYFEHINVTGITFQYVDNQPVGLCKAHQLIYITTAGGDIFSDEMGFGYVKLMGELFYGIKDFRYIKLEGLDIWGADVEGLLEGCMEEVRKMTF